MKRSKKRNSQLIFNSLKNGFSIIELMIGTAILTMLIYAFTQFLSGAMKGQRHVQNAVDFDILKTNLNLILNTKACDGAFQSASGTPIQLTLPAGLSWATLTTTPPTHVISVGSPLAIAKIKQNNTEIAAINQNLGGGMKLTKLEFVEATFDGDQSVITDATTTPPTTVLYKAFLAQLHIEVTKQSGSSGLPSFDTNLGVRILVNPLGAPTQGAVERCGASQAIAPPAPTYQSHCAWTVSWPSIVGNCSPTTCASGDQLLDTSCYVTSVWSGNWTIGLCSNTCLRNSSATPNSSIAYTSRCGWAKDMVSISGFTDSPGDCTPPACSAGTTFVGKSCFATAPWWGGGWWAVGHCENSCIK